MMRAITSLTHKPTTMVGLPPFLPLIGSMLCLPLCRWFLFLLSLLDEHPIRQNGRRLTRASTASVNATASPPKGRQTRNSRRIQFDDAYEEEESEGPTTRNLRTRTSRPNYALIPSSDVVANNSRSERNSHGHKLGSKSGSGGSKRSGGGYNRIPWNSTGRELSRHLGLSAPGEDSVCCSDIRYGSTGALLSLGLLTPPPPLFFSSGR